MSNPLDFVIFLLYKFLVIAISFSLHEYAHARTALRCGDATAKYMGRVTLDPRAHLTLAGTVSLFLLGFGWGKPVPVDPGQFRHRVRDDILVSLAGIAMNLLLFLVCLVLSVVVNAFLWTGGSAFAPAGLLNPFSGALGDLIAHGSVSETVRTLSDLFAHPWLFYIQRFLLLMAETNLILALFNLLPVPPLDGSHLFSDLIFKNRLRLSPQTFMVIQYMLIAAALVGILTGVFHSACGAVYTGVLNLLLAVTGQA